MGLFGSIFKLAGKVGKFGLSKLTHGASDQVLKVLKGRGQVHQVLAKSSTDPTEQEKALVAKLNYGSPRTLSTVQVLDGAGRRGFVEGYSSKRAGKGGSTGKRKKTGMEYTVADPSRLAAMQKFAAERGGTARLMTRKELDLPELGPGITRYPKKRQKGFKKDGSPRKPPSPAQLAARARFAAMAAARRSR
jgi:hypothetical protein